MAVLGPRLCARAPSSRGERGPLFIAVRGPLSRPLPPRSTGSRRTGSAAVAHRPSRSAARGIPPDQGSNPRPPHRQADSQPLRHQGSPLIHFEFIFVYGVRDCSNFIILHVAVQFSRHHLLKRLSFLHCISLPPLS